MPCDFDQLPHAGIRNLVPYVPGKSAEELAQERGLTDIIKLASNENPLGCSPLVTQALANMSGKQIATYPMSVNHPLREKLANRLAVSKEMITLGNGSDSLFCSLLTCFALHNNKHILTHDYAFSSYAIQAKTLGIPVVSTPLKSNWDVNMDAMINACNEKTALIFIANPNNPTGVLISPKEIEHLLNSIPVTTIVVLDEAYYEYTRALSSVFPERTNVFPAQAGTHPDTGIDVSIAIVPRLRGEDSVCGKNNSYSIDLLLNKHPNLVITRTFSKAYGLAGLRLGYAIANPQITALLYRIQLPFVVNIAALTAGFAALDDDEFIQQTIQLNEQGLEQVQLGLSALGLTQLPTATNFITFDCNTDSMPIYQGLLNYGIIVRPLHPYGLNTYLRVTIGTQEQNQRFLETLATELHHEK